MSTTNPTTIRLSITNEVRNGLRLAKKRYPTLSDPEILKLGLSKIITEYEEATTGDDSTAEIKRTAARAIGSDYLSDSEEDVYTSAAGKRVRFS